MEKLMVTGLLLVFCTVLISTGASKAVYAQLGESVTLKSAIDGNFYQYLYWKFGQGKTQLAWWNHLGGKGVTKDEAWAKKLTLTQDSLTISNVQPENFGSYDCDIHSKGVDVTLSTFKLIRVNVEVDPTEPLLPGDPLTVSCSVDHRREVDVYWLRPDGTRVTPTNQPSLTVQVTSRDHGTWACVIAGDKQVAVPVRVIGLSPAPSLPQFTSTSDALSLPCSFPSDLPWEKLRAKGVREVAWHFLPQSASGRGAGAARRLFSLSVEQLSWREEEQRELTPAQGLRSGDLSLSRRSSREDDRGDYVCAVRFQNGVTLNRTIHLDVLQIVASPGWYILSGQPVNLTCGVGHRLTPDLRLQWTPPQHSSLSPLSPGPHPQLLAIPGAVGGDGGKWMCALWRNESLLASASQTLTIEDKLSVWMLATIGGAAAFALLLLLLLIGGLLLHRRRHRMGRLRQRLCRCKHPKPKGFYRT